MDQSLADVRPDAPVTLHYRGRQFQGVLSLPESRMRSQRSLVVAKTLEPTLRTVDLAEEPIRINPILSQSMDRARRLLTAGLALVVTGESGAGKTLFAKTVARCCFGDDSEFVFIDCASLEPQTDLAAFLQRRMSSPKTCLLIDRIDEMSETHQTALLAVLENDRQAGANGIGVIVISTQDLDQLVRDHRMRADLMHRLKGGQIIPVSPAGGAGSWRQRSTIFSRWNARHLASLSLCSTRTRGWC